MLYQGLGALNIKEYLKRVVATKGKHKPGFTLIELLVVIAIIALLLSILTPSLSAIKKKATGAVCVTRERSLILAYTLYAEDNSDFLASSCTNPGATNPNVYGCWVIQPTYYEGGLTMENRKQGIRDGALFPYIESVDFFHCPGDDRIKQPEASGACAFRSYSIVDGLSSWYAGDPGYEAGGFTYGPDHYAYLKLTQVKRPSDAICFLEEAERIAGYNAISWTMFVLTPRIWDPCAIFHKDSSSFGFLDGHSELQKWKDEETIRIFTEGAKEPENFLDFDNPDYIYLRENFPFERERHL